MTNYFSILRITDGTFNENGQLNELNLLNRRSGYTLDEWLQAVPEVKQGGQFVDSAMSDGRFLRWARWGNATETMTLMASAQDQDILIGYLNDLLDWIVAVQEYWTGQFRNKPIYLEAKSGYETNTRYAIIRNMTVPSLVAPYAAPFAPEVGQSVTGEPISLTIERSEWFDKPPGQTTQLITQSSLYSFDWSTYGSLSTDPTGVIRCMIENANGDLLIGTDAGGTIWSSADDGANWSIEQSTGLVGSVNDFCIDENGNLYAAISGDTSARGIWKSTDDGATWTRVHDPSAGNGFWGIEYNPRTHWIVGVGHQDASVTGHTGRIASSNDYGSSWNTSIHWGAERFISVITTWPDNRWIVLAARDPAFILSSKTDDPSAAVGAWNTQALPILVGAGTKLVWLEHSPTHFPDGGNAEYEALAITWDAANNLNRIYACRFVDWDVPYDYPYGDWTRWTQRTAFGTSRLFSVFNDQHHRIWAGGANVIYLCDQDAGYTWYQKWTPSGDFYSVFWHEATEDLLAGENGEVFGRTDHSLTDVGFAVDESDLSFFSNGRFRFGVTHLYRYDVSTAPYWTQLIGATLPYELLPSVPAVGDGFYIGVETGLAIDTWKFSNLIFDLVEGAYDLTLEWSYWNGAGWTAFGATNFYDGTADLTVEGRTAISIDDSVISWGTGSLNGVTAYWVRAEVTAIGVDPTPPTQQNQDPFFEIHPYIQYDGSLIDGTLPAFGRINLFQLGATNLEWDRVIMGVRSLSRGENFHAFINLSDYGEVPGITIDLNATYAAYASSSYTTTGRKVNFQVTVGGDLNDWFTVAQVNISNALVEEYFGVYRVFLRAGASGTSSSWKIRGWVRYGSGGMKLYTPTSVFPAVTANNILIDLGQVQLPVVDQTLELIDRIPDEAQIGIDVAQLTNTNNALYLEDIILIPVDEWGGDFRNPGATAQIGADFYLTSLNQGDLLDVDSCTNPRSRISSFARKAQSRQVVGHWEPVANGPVTLPLGEQARLWILTAQAFNSPVWLWESQPNYLGAGILSYIQRFMGLRGSR